MVYKIRNIIYDDIFKIKKIRNEQMDVLRQNNILTDNDQEKWYNELIKPSYISKTKVLNFTILYNEKFIGYGGLVNIEYDNKKGEVSFLVEKERTLNNNIYENDFTFFLNFISEYASNQLKLHKIWTETYEFRKFHISILEKNMFKVEGVLKESIYLNSKFINSILHGLILENN
tara:strand:- start:18416 stop:18937 length:522 start_codon:yes stop_codon:yes gene_type:complete